MFKITIVQLMNQVGIRGRSGGCGPSSSRTWGSHPHRPGIRSVGLCGTFTSYVPA